MPPKSSKARRAKTAEATKEIAHTECQTDFYDEEFERDMHGIRTLKSSIAVEEGSSSSIALRNPNVLLMQLKTSVRIISKLSSDAQKTRKENERIVSFFGEIFRLVRAMRSEYDSTFLNVRDNMKAMSSDMGRYMEEVQEFLSKQKSLAEEERKRYKSSMKGKDVQIEHLQDQLKTSNENLSTVMQALEAQQRRITVAERDVHTSRDEVREVNKKLSDQLYLAGNQKCMSCQANEKVREMLSNEVAEKTNTANMFHQKCCEMDNQLMQQKHVNEILSRAVDKHAFSEKAYRGEFERIKAEYEALIVETRTLRSQAKIDAANAAATASVITPPDSSASDKSSKEDSHDTGSIHSTPNGTSSPSTGAGNGSHPQKGTFGSSCFAASSSAGSSSTGNLERPYSAASTASGNNNNNNKHHDAVSGKSRQVRGRELLLPMPPGHKPAKPVKPHHHNNPHQQQKHAKDSHHVNAKFDGHHQFTTSKHQHNAPPQQHNNNRPMSGGKRLSLSSLQDSVDGSKKISSPAITSTSTPGGGAASGGAGVEKDGEPATSSSSNMSVDTLIEVDAAEADDGESEEQPSGLKTPPLVALFSKRDEQTKNVAEKRKTSGTLQSGDMQEATTLLLPFERELASSRSAENLVREEEKLSKARQKVAQDARKRATAQQAKGSGSRSGVEGGGGTFVPKLFSVVPSSSSSTAAEANAEDDGDHNISTQKISKDGQKRRPYAPKKRTSEDISSTATINNVSPSTSAMARNVIGAGSEVVIRSQRDRKLARQALKRAKRTKLNNGATALNGMAALQREATTSSERAVRGFGSPPTSSSKVLADIVKILGRAAEEKDTSTAAESSVTRVVDEAGDKANAANKTNVDSDKPSNETAQTSRKSSNARPTSSSSTTSNSVGRKRARESFDSPTDVRGKSARRPLVRKSFYNNPTRRTNAPAPTPLFGRPFNPTAAFTLQQQQRLAEVRRIAAAQQQQQQQQQVAAVVREQVMLREQQLIRDRQIMHEQQQALANEQRQQQQQQLRREQQQAHQIQLIREQQRQGLLQLQQPQMMNQQQQMRPQQWLLNRPMNGGDNMFGGIVNLPRPATAQQQFQQGGMDAFGRQQQLPPRPPSGMPRPPDSPLAFRQASTAAGGLPWHGGGAPPPPQFHQQGGGPPPGPSSSWVPRMYSRRS